MKYQSHLGSTLLPAGIRAGLVKHNLEVSTLVQNTLASAQGVITDSGALAVNTGKFTGRTPEDKYVVQDALTENTVWWGEVNKPMKEDTFYKLLAKMSDFCLGADLYVHDVFACADKEMRISVRVITNSAIHAHFVANMFITPTESERANFKTEHTVFCLPDFVANPATDGT
jgi:phosphoenolpyruvate carboxykinase (ATP)